MKRYGECLIDDSKYIEKARKDRLTHLKNKVFMKLSEQIEYEKEYTLKFNIEKGFRIQDENGMNIVSEDVYNSIKRLKEKKKRVATNPYRNMYLFEHYKIELEILPKDKPITQIFMPKEVKE